MANRRFAVRARKRVMSWQGSLLDFSDIVVGTPQLVTVISEAILENFPTPTLIRTRGRLAVLADTSSTPGAFGVLTMGVIVVTAAAQTAGAVPTPSTDVGSDWLWWNRAIVGAAAGDVIGEEVTIDRMDVDSKAMRKIGNNEVVVFVAELISCEGTLVVNLCGGLRFLLKAP